MLTTLLESRTSALRNIAGSCNGSDEFKQLLNDATRRLLRRGDWSGTVVRIKVCVRKGCVVWPRYVGQVRKLNVCRTPLQGKNLWWDFTTEQLDRPCDGTTGLTQYGKSPTFDDIRGGDRTVRAYPMCQADIGKTITIFGEDEYGQPLKQRDSDNNWIDGITLTLSLPFTVTTKDIKCIDRVLKDETQCRVYLYAYDTVNSALEDLAFYEPSETNPDYERTHLNLSCSTDCDQTKSVIALVKLKFIPAKHDTDLVLIQNLDALKLMMQAIKFEEANDRANARQYEADAIRELNLELTDNQPDDQMPVSLGSLGHTGIGTQRLF